VPAQRQQKKTMTTYTPIGYAWSDTALARFIADFGYGSLDGLQGAATADPERFWRDVADGVGIEWMRPYKKAVDLSRGAPWPQWFVGGELNLFDNLVGKHARRHPDKIALRWQGEGDEICVMTYAELENEATRLASGMAGLGIGKGDRVAVYLPMATEAVVVMLATTLLGAIVMPLFSGYGADSVASRVRDCEAKLLVCAESFSRRGKFVDMLGEARAAAAACPSLRHLVVARRAGQSGQSTVTPVGVAEVDYRELIAATIAATVGNGCHTADTPLMLIYTSGTTGRPKGVVHTHAGFPLKAAQDMMMAFDFGADDTLMWVTDMGWMMGPWLVFGGLLFGATIVMYEGTPDYPAPDRLWRLVEGHGVTHLGLSPTLVRLLMAAGDQWLQPSRLSSLRVFGSTGEPWNESPWLWLYENVGESRRPIINYSGGTEIGGGILACFPGLPQKPCAFNGPIPGMAADVAGPQGEATPRGEVGELVIRGGWPGMAHGFWQDDARYLEAYWSRFPDVWVHGDWARVDADGFWFVNGRSDDTIKVAGKRVGPVEYESALVAHAEVVEAVAIGVPDDLKGESAICFVTLAGAEAASAEERRQLESDLREFVAESLGKPFKPKRVYVIPSLPKTRNGKVLRRVVKNAYLGQDLGDLTALDNAECIAAIRVCGSGSATVSAGLEVVAS
jgi:acetyl-CoA synthetase